jgi:hypothetical protein
MQQTTWRQSDIFPFIASAIIAEYQQHQRFITAQEIARAILRDADARRVIDAACARQGNSAEHTATNMVAWFSQRITAEQSEWRLAFERTRINNQYAYKPIAKPSDQATPPRVANESP